MTREVRTFKVEWVDKFFVREVKGKPVCLICSKALSHNKQTNIARHYTTNHGDYDTRYPPDTRRRREHLDRLLSQAEQQRRMVTGQSVSQAKRAATVASYQVAYEIGKSMAPLSHSELIKSCITKVAHTLFPDKQSIHSAFESVALSRNTCTRRVEQIGDSIQESVIVDLQICNSFSMALDETNDINDTAQLAVFVRYEKDSIMHERLLTVLSLSGRTTGSIIFDTFKTFMERHNIPMDKIVGVATDGAPAMIGRNTGFVKHLRDVCPKILACHCIIHESVLCAKLKDDYADLMLRVMKMINFLKSQSGLRHRQLIAFLRGLDADYDDLLTHNNVRLVAIKLL